MLYNNDDCLDSLRIDVNNDGTIDLVISTYYGLYDNWTPTSPGYFTSSIKSDQYSTRIGFDTSLISSFPIQYIIKSISPGVPVDYKINNSMKWYNWGKISNGYFGTESLSSFVQDTAYLPFLFGSNGDSYYGWIRFEVQTGGTFAGQYIRITVYELAYNDVPNFEILAGQKENRKEY
jgi:hypothetical protein